MKFGFVFAGRHGTYQVRAEIGGGAFGRVFRARAEDGRAVAVKVLDQLHEDAVARFRREVKIMGGLTHANIIELVDYGVSGDRVWYAMPEMPGGTLADVINRDRSWEEVLEILAQVADGLAAYHRRGGIHRDVKPENILLDVDGRPRLGDFGLARCPEITGDSMTTTAAGTAPYMAPEVWQHKACAASDVYALGIVFWELVNGERHNVPAKPPRLLKVGPEFEVMEQLFIEMTAADPDDRPGAPEVARQCRLFLRKIRAIRAEEEASESAGGSVWPWVLGAVAVAGVVLGALVLVGAEADDS